MSVFIIINTTLKDRSLIVTASIKSTLASIIKKTYKHRHCLYRYHDDDDLVLIQNIER